MENVVNIEFQGGGEPCRDKKTKNFCFDEILSSLKLKKLEFPSKIAFSIAEAMIALLVVGIALAAMAPILSKKMVGENKNSGTIPAGMIAFFDRPCNNVSGWTDVPTEWQGRYPRIVGSYKIYDINGNAQDASISYNQQYDDAIRDISGGFGRKYGGEDSQLFGEPIATEGVFDKSTVTSYPGGDFHDWQNSEMTEWVSFFASRVVPVAPENRPKTVGLYMCRKT